MLDGFTPAEIATVGITMCLRWSGSGPPLPLQHGFPETQIMGRHVVRAFSEWDQSQSAEEPSGPSAPLRCIPPPLPQAPVQG